MRFIGQYTPEGGRLRLENINAYAIRLVPADKAGRGYPVSLVPNGEESASEKIDGSRVYRPGFLVTSAEVFVQAGDTTRWHVYADRVDNASTTCQPRQDPHGYLQTRGGDAQVLFLFDAREHPTRFAPLLADLTTDDRTAIIRPDLPEVFTLHENAASVGRAWDVSRFSNVAFCIEQYTQSGNGLAWSFKPRVSLCGSDSDGLAGLELVTMGSVGNFGSISTPPWNLEQGRIHLGASIDSTGTHTRTLAETMPYLRFSLRVEANSVSQPDIVSIERLRIYAVAW